LQSISILQFFRSNKDAMIARREAGQVASRKLSA